LRIAVVNLTGGSLSGGYRKYLQNILPLMAKDKRVDGLDVFIPAGHAYIFTNNAYTLHNIPVDNLFNNKAWLRSELANHQFDVVFIPSAIWINCGQTPIVIMIQNMAPLADPFGGNPLKECVKNIGLFIMYLYACRRANRVIAVSKFVKTYLTEKWRIVRHRIGLVYYGIDNTSLVCLDEHSAIASLESLPFLFTAGSIRPARGLEDVIKALAIQNKEQPVQLAIGGNVDSGMEPYFIRLKKMAANSGITECIHWLGKLNDAEMAWCYSHCEAFVMTSRVESFGMIAGEAMAYGCMCISSDNPCLPEIFGSSALYYPPKDFTTLAKQIQAVISMGQTERSAMSSAAKDIASRFSWVICAHKTVNELQKALQ
jgi:glycosyltransferase involved in cell wall biosynthesis